MSEETFTEQSNADEPEVKAEAEEMISEGSPVDVRPVDEQLVDAKAKAAEYLDGWQRARADLDNYRKRVTRERAEWNDTARSEVILAVLPALDDFDRALENLPEDIAKHQWVSGVVLAHRKLVSQIAELGVSEIEAEGQTFDPALHEAVTHEESKDHKSGQIISVVRKGYRMGDRVIRPAMVRVAA